MFITKYLDAVRLKDCDGRDLKTLVVRIDRHAKGDKAGGSLEGVQRAYIRLGAKHVPQLKLLSAMLDRFVDDVTPDDPDDA
jgi:hypothetical protein